MARLWIKSTECKYKEYERRLKEHFINGMNDEAITAKIIKKLTALKHTSEVTNEQVLVWVQRVEVQKAQKAVLDI